VGHVRCMVEMGNVRRILVKNLMEVTSWET
jgi:hypothetical protein